MKSGITYETAFPAKNEGLKARSPKQVYIYGNLGVPDRLSAKRFNALK